MMIGYSLPMHVRTCVCVHVCVHVCVRACMRACVRVCSCVYTTPIVAYRYLCIDVPVENLSNDLTPGTPMVIPDLKTVLFEIGS